jgi:dihydropteroate synthase
MAEPAQAAEALVVRDLELRFGSRTYVMGILNVTPDSFSGDGLLGSVPAPGGDALLARARRQGLAMMAEGADILDIGGQSTRPGHQPVTEAEELARVVDVVAALRDALPGVPLSVDTTRERVAAAALDAGVDILNDVSAVTHATPLAALAGERGAPYVLMHGRARPAYVDVVAEVLADLRAAVERATRQGCPEHLLIVDPGIGFGKTAEQNLVLLAGLARLGSLGRPVLLGTSRKSTLGRVLGLPPEERLEGTLATTALGIASGVDIVRVHDVAANVRVARMSDAIVRGTWRDEGTGPGPSGSASGIAAEQGTD